MIDLLINMSEIYGRPNRDSGVAADDNDDDGGDQFVREQHATLACDDLGLNETGPLIDRVYSNGKRRSCVRCFRVNVSRLA